MRRYFSLTYGGILDTPVEVFIILYEDICSKSIRSYNLVINNFLKISRQNILKNKKIVIG